MKVNFSTILEDCKARYKAFEGDVKIDRAPRSFENAILEEPNNPIIAEIKPSSPVGKLREVVDPGALAQDIVEGGACGISVLTEEKYFGGSLNNLERVSKASKVPVLRKDFIFHEAQIPESYYYGADSLLLIASFFSVLDLGRFIGSCRDRGMEPLVEVHSLKDVAKADKAGARFFAINNRDKDTLEIDLDRSRVFSKGIDGIKVSASGITTEEDLRFVLEYCDAALVGSALMKAENVKETLREFVYGT
ncbi:MAG: indole-3-glycerol-phosphate synthase [Candidatus Hydrothermarchaeales archaeon]